MPVVLEAEARCVARRNEARDYCGPVRSFHARRLEKEVIDCHTLHAKYLAAVDQPSAIGSARLRARTQRNDRVVGLRAGPAAYEAFGRYSAQLLVDIRCFELAVQIDQQPDGVEVLVDRQCRRTASLRQTFLRLDSLERLHSVDMEFLRDLSESLST
jgi:hypothetical protein